MKATGAKRKPKSPPRSLRDQLVWQAEKIANGAKISRGARIVVAITDVNGDWVGVASNTTPPDVEGILRSALLGADRRDGSVIEVVGEEVSNRPLLEVKQP